MLKIVINNQPVDTAGMKIPLNLKSPFPFDPSNNTIESSFAFGIKLPRTERNMVIFDFPHRAGN